MQRFRIFPRILPRILLITSLASVGMATANDGKPAALFDGKTFSGWAGDTKATGRMQDGCIVGGSLSKKIPRNQFLATKDSYANFVLRLKFKLLGDSKKGF